MDGKEQKKLWFKLIREAAVVHLQLFIFYCKIFLPPSLNISNTVNYFFIWKLRIKMGWQMPACIPKHPSGQPHHLLHLPAQLRPLLKGLHLLANHPVESLLVTACNAAQPFFIRWQVEVLKK